MNLVEIISAAFGAGQSLAILMRLQIGEKTGAETPKNDCRESIASSAQQMGFSS
jgi:hypothetical protein